MGYPSDVVASLLHEGEVVGLIMDLEGKPTLYNLRVETRELPNNLYEFSIGTANAEAAAGTGWSEVQNANNQWLVVPPQDNQLYQVFYGISPGYAQVYRANPANVSLGALRVPITIGGTTGYITGRQSPYWTPSSLSEFFTIKEMNPAFNGYHPYAIPASINVRMNFLVARYHVTLQPDSVTPKRKVTMGSAERLMLVPNWISS